MRFLWLSHLIPFPPLGGARQRSFGILRELSREFDVTFAGFNQADFCSPEEVEEACSGLSQYCTIAFTEPIPSDLRKFGKHRLAARSLFTRDPYTVNWLSSRRFRERLLSTVARLQPDLVHLDTISLAPYRTLAPRAVATLNHHNVESQMLLRRAEHATSPVARSYYRQEARRLQRFESAVAPQFGLHLVCSWPDAERLRLVNAGARAAVIPNGVDIEYFRPSIPPPQRTTKSLIFVGGLSWYPNLSAVKFLCQKIWSQIPDEDATLTIVGRSPPEWLVALSGRDPRVRVPGWVDDVRPLMERAAVYACPVFDGGGTKLKVLDALAMGVPLVANPVACEGIDVEDGCHVLLASTPSEFLRKIRLLWDDLAVGERLSANGIELIHGTYSYSVIGERLRQLYADLVMSRDSSRSGAKKGRGEPPEPPVQGA